MKSLENADVSGKTVLMRVDFNVFPVRPHELRIEKIVPTIEYLLSKKAKVILLTHIEENDGRIPSSKILLLPKLLPSYAGFRFEEEIKNLSKVFNPKHPATLILGGGKIETKLPILKKLLPKFDHVLLGGFLLNLFILGREPFFSRKLVLPSQVVASGKKVLDVGPASFSEWGKIIRSSKFIVWNGPLGYLEKGHIQGTKKLISILSQIKIPVIIGGGDTLACLPASSVGRLPKNIFVSTGGGAMLEYLVHKTLPGIKALDKK